MQSLSTTSRRGPYQSSLATRRKLLQAVAAGPGRGAADLVRATGLPWSTVAHHLRGLVERGELVARQDASRLRYWPGSGPA